MRFQSLLAVCGLSTFFFALPLSAAEIPPSPLSPEQSLKHFQLDPGLKIELAAAEPLVVDPVAVRFDESGRMWVVEMRDYPNGPPSGEPPLSRIKVLEDSDGDGRYDTARLFADRLLFATGLQPWRGGAFVTLAGRLAYMKDNDGDGQADVDETWFNGFVQQNPQLRANHPQLSLDGRIYVANGLRGGTVVSLRSPGAPSIPLNRMDFRFDPHDGGAEAVSGGSQFGLTFNDSLQRFICSNRNPLKHVVLEDRYLKRNPFLAVPEVTHDAAAFAERSRVYPLTRAWTTSTLHAGQFTAACGVHLYRGEALGDGYYGNGFTCEPTGNLVHREVVQRAGATYTSLPAYDDRDFLASPDEWFRPVNLELGPDGAMYVVDMYRAVIEHPEFVPDELKNRPDLRLGDDRGRIYRITRADRAYPGKPADFGKKSSDELAALLEDGNAWTRETAGRLLIERQDRGAAAALRRLARDSSRPAARIAALHLLEVLDDLPDELLGAALGDRDAAVVQQAILLCEGRLKANRSLAESIAKAALADRATAAVRFQAALALGELPESETLAWLAPIAFAGADDVWTRHAVCTAVPKRPGELFKAILQLPGSQAADLSAGQRLLLEDLASLVAARHERDEIADLLAAISAPETKSRSQQALAHGIVLRLAQSLARRGHSLADVQAKLRDARPELTAALDALWSDAASLAADEKSDESVRQQAVALLGYSPQVSAAEALARMATSEPSQALRLRAIEALSQHRRPEVAPLLLAGYASQTPAARRAVLDAVLAAPDRTKLLLDEIAARRIAPSELDRVRLDRLVKHKDAEIRGRANKLFADAIPADRQKVLAAYQSVLSMAADPQRGREVFQKNCTACHRVAGIGTDVAPDIADSRVKKPEQLLTDILQPNRAIDANYMSYLAATVDGRQFTGIVVSDTAGSVTLKLPEGKQISLLRQDIEEFRSTGVSLMPEGLEKNIPPQQMADLISFIKNWRYLDGKTPLSAGK